MSIDTFTDACRSPVEQLGRMVDRVEQEQWKIDHDEANYVCQLESVIANCIATCDYVLSFAQYFRAYGPLLGDCPSIHDSGKAFIHCFTEVIDRGNRLKEQAAMFDQYSIERLGELSERLGGAEAALHEIERYWPTLTDQCVKEAHAEYEAGQFQTLTEIIHELRSSNSKAGT